VQRPRGKNKGAVRELDEKSPTLTPSAWEQNNHLVKGIHYRKLTPLECERLQTLPDNYTEGVSNTQRYKMIGNGWTIEVIKHILKNIKGEYNG
jgi:site-specific DNA-cytosine methylase